MFYFKVLNYKKKKIRSINLKKQIYTSEKATIFNIQKFSVHDGPGIRSVIFLKGCPLRCQWCANPESINGYSELMFYQDKCIGCKKCLSTCKNNAIQLVDGKLEFERDLCKNCGRCAKTCYADARKIIGQERGVESVKAEINEDMVFFKNSDGGITFSGGEPLLWPGFVRKLAEFYKNLEISVAIETCGFVPWKNFQKIIAYVDLVMFDLKFIQAKKHFKYLGCSNELIINNLFKISKYAETIVRMPIIPSINDSKEDIQATGKFLLSFSDRIKRVEILPYHNWARNKYEGLGRKYLLNDIKTPSNEYMKSIKEILEKYGLQIQIGG
ncbi:MAG: glycyl-radical enzyme activating protein [Actinobacteria bacterium]|nr:glycyl-radical enzyme activating protein [Actinomycetota bacterium]